MPRGIPTGYIAALEQRLLATELALFEEMWHSQSTTRNELPDQTRNELVAQFSETGAKQSKASKTKEWQTLPLQSTSERSAWWFSKSHQFGQGAWASHQSESAAGHQDTAETAEMSEERSHYTIDWSTPPLGQQTNELGRRAAMHSSQLPNTTQANQLPESDLHTNATSTALADTPTSYHTASTQDIEQSPRNPSYPAAYASNPGRDNTLLHGNLEESVRRVDREHMVAEDWRYEQSEASVALNSPRDAAYIAKTQSYKYF